ncbi:MAG: hypothetical protein KJO81_00230, partial [Gammaproteobacteria bacterium]|nr:hypothetical protein [Gammaproteobacteria bacterium]
HWMYKNKDAGNDNTAPHIRTRKWLNTVSEMQYRSGSSLEFLESVKVDLYRDEIYVFTPRGDIMSCRLMLQRSILPMPCTQILVIIVLLRKLIAD